MSNYLERYSFVLYLLTLVVIVGGLTIVIVKFIHQTSKIVQYNDAAAKIASNQDNKSLLISLERTKDSGVSFIASASDDSLVSKVEIYINGKLLCSDTSSPYDCTWTMPSPSGVQYFLQAKAYNRAGVVASTAQIKVTSK